MRDKKMGRWAWKRPGGGRHDLPSISAKKKEFLISELFSVALSSLHRRKHLLQCSSSTNRPNFVKKKPRQRQTGCLLGNRLDLTRLLVAPPVTGASLIAALALRSSSLLVGGSLDTLAEEALTLGADDGQNALERAAPHHQTTLNLGPLLLAEHAVSSAVDEELLLELGELTLDQTGTDGVDDPHLDVGGGHAQGRGDGGVGERA